MTPADDIIVSPTSTVNPKFKDLTGMKFGRLRVVEHLGKSKRTRQSYWKCLCDCGLEVNVFGPRMINGNTSSCGCLRTEMLAARCRDKEFRSTWNVCIHGECRGGSTPEYRAWTLMRDRCFNPMSKAFKDYGARGITICERWSDFKNFLIDVGRKPSPRHSVGRIDNNGIYSPENVRWELPQQQANNKRNNRLLTHNGLTLTMAQWARRQGINYWTLADRVRRGFPIDLALSSRRFSTQGRSFPGVHLPSI